MGNTNRLPATPIYSASINGNGKIVGVRVGVPSGQSFNSTTRMPHPKKDEAQLPPVLPGHGVFIARLPFGINAEQVEQSFAQFGPILNGANGIQVDTFVVFFVWTGFLGSRRSQWMLCVCDV